MSDQYSDTRECRSCGSETPAGFRYCLACVQAERPGLATQDRIATLERDVERLAGLWDLDRAGHNAMRRERDRAVEACRVLTDSGLVFREVAARWHAALIRIEAEGCASYKHDIWCPACTAHSALQTVGPCHHAEAVTRPCAKCLAER